MKTIIVGAGISGLTAAHRLQEAGEAFLLLEAGNEPGGKVITREYEGHLLEHGPNTFLNSHKGLMELLDELGLHGEIEQAAPGAKKRFILRGRRLLPLPSDPLGILMTPLLSPPARVRVLLEVLLARREDDPDESVEAFVARHFGREVARTVAGPFVSGIFAGDPTKLSMAAAFPRAKEMEQKYRSLLLGMIRRDGPRAKLCSLRGGLGKLPEALAARIQEEMVTRASVRSVTHWFDHYLVSTDEHEYDCDNVILATPAYAAAQLLKNICPKAAERIAGIKSVPMKVLHALVPRNILRHPLDGFGCLVPRSEKIRHLGVVFNSSCFPSRSPANEVLLTTFVGGVFDPKVMETEDRRLIGEIGREHAGIGLYNGTADFAPVVSWPRAIPQYEAGHLNRVKEIAAALEACPGILLAGNYLRGIALGDCVNAGNEAARTIMQNKPTTP